MTRQSTSPGSDPRHVSLVALPDAVVSTLSGIYDVMNAFALMGLPNPKAPFRIEIVGEKTGPLALASGVPIQVQRPVAEIKTTDIVIVPSVLLRPEGWKKGRYPGLVDWLRTMYDRGAVLCSACSGIFLLAETGLFDGRDATVHFGYAGATAAQEVARLYALQWHQEGLTPYIVFEGKRDHGDGDIQSAQQWLDTHFSVAHPVEEMIKRSRLAERTFKLRFTQATGLTPLAYVQRLRIEDAKRRLERTDAPIDKIIWQVGYEDAAFFRRLFKRTTGMAPGAYRKRFRIPDFARP